MQISRIKQIVLNYVVCWAFVTCPRSPSEGCTFDPRRCRHNKLHTRLRDYDEIRSELHWFAAISLLTGEKTRYFLPVSIAALVHSHLQRIENLFTHVAYFRLREVQHDTRWPNPVLPGESGTPRRKDACCRDGRGTRVSWRNAALYYVDPATVCLATASDWSVT